MPSSALTKDRRVSRRRNIELKYSLMLDNKQYQGLSINISQGGMFLNKSNESMHEDRLTGTGSVAIQTTIGTIQTDCRVVYSGIYGIGIQFIDSTEDTLQLIARLIDE